MTTEAINVALAARDIAAFRWIRVRVRVRVSLLKQDHVMHVNA